MGVSRVANQVARLGDTVEAALVAALDMAGKPRRKHITPLPLGEGPGVTGSTMSPLSLRARATKNGAKARNSGSLVSLPVQIAKRQQKNGPQSATKSPTPDTKRLKTGQNGAEIKNSPLSPRERGRG